MAAITDLNELLSSMAPKVRGEEFVYCTVDGDYGDFKSLEPIACFLEDEGLSLVIPKANALAEKIPFDSSFRMITLTVHSSLEAVGLTSAVASKLTEHNISANVIAAHHHDHIMVPVDKAEAAMAALAEL